MNEEVFYFGRNDATTASKSVYSLISFPSSARYPGIVNLKSVPLETNSYALSRRGDDVTATYVDISFTFWFEVAKGIGEING